MPRRVLFFALVLGALASPSDTRSIIRFEETAAKSGLRFVSHSGATGQFHQIELMGGGLAALDYNNDGCMDLYVTNGAAIPSLRKTGPEFFNRLYRNNCDGTFRDVTDSAGVAGEGYSIAVAAADFDNDGYVDLFVAGVNRNSLFRNLGNGRFEDVTDKANVSGVDAKMGKPWSVSAGWFDYDNDGWLDLFVSNYVVWDAAKEPVCGPPDARIYCHPNTYTGLPNQLFHNNRDGTFTDVSQSSGIARSTGKGMGAVFADFDGDGFTDIFVANDSMRSFLFHNQHDGTFREIGLEAGVALRDDGAAIAGMGADARDFDDDGHPDLVVSGMINDGFQLFRNSGGGTAFEDAGQRSGVTMQTKQLTGWSLGMFDFDNDGRKDLFFAVSHFPGLEKYLGRPSGQPNRILRGIDGKHFEDVSAQAGADFQLAALHHGAAFADFDNDGKVDIAVTSMDASVKLFHNVTSGAGHWLALQLRGRKSNRDGLGASVAVTLDDGRVLHNHATTSVGYASSSEPMVRFGLGPNERAAKVSIRWPAGGLQEIENVEGDRVIVVEEAVKER